MHYSEAVILELIKNHNWTTYASTLELRVEDAVDSGEISNGSRLVSFNFDETGRWAIIKYGFGVNSDVELDGRLYSNNIECFSEIITAYAIGLTKCETNIDRNKLVESMNTYILEKMYHFK